MKKYLLTLLTALLIFCGTAFGTVDSTEQTVTFNCNGSTVAFDFTFNVGETTDIKVILTDSVGTQTTLTETTDYSVTCTATNWDSGLNPTEWDCTQGGTVTTVSTYASGNTITITTDIPITQETEYTENMPALYANFEASLDKLTRIDKQFDAELEALETTTNSTGTTYYIPTVNGDYYGDKISLKANQSTSLGQVCYMASDGDMTLARANAYATSQGNLGMATTTIGSGAAGIFLQEGYICNTSWAFATVGAAIYIDPDTAGAITTTEPEAGEYVRIIGYVASSKAIKFCPDNTVIKKKAE